MKKSITILGLLARRQKSIPVFIAGFAVMGLLAVLLTSFSSKLALDAITVTHESLFQALIPLVCSLIALGAVSGLKDLLSGLLRKVSMRFRYDLLVDFERVKFSGDYQNVFFGQKTSDDQGANQNLSGLQIINEAQGSIQTDNSAVPQVPLQMATIIQALLSVVVMSSIIALVNPIILLVIAVGVIAQIVFVAFRKRVHARNMKRLADAAVKSNYVKRSMQSHKNIQDIRVSSLTHYLLSMAKSAFSTQKSIVTQEGKIDLLGEVTSLIFACLRDGLAYMVLLAQLLAGRFSIGDFLFLFGIIGSFATAINSVIDAFNQLLFNDKELELFLRAYTYLTQQLKHNQARLSPQELTQPLTVRFDHVSFGYNPDKPVINDMCVSFDGHERVGIVGENGSGKTTFIALMLGLLHPDSGQIYINNTEISTIHPDDIRQLFGVLYQDTALYPLTIRQHMLADEQNSLPAEQEHVDSQQDSHKQDAQLWDLLEQVKLKDVVSNLAHELDQELVEGIKPGAVGLSGGQAQRLSLARVLFHQTPGLICDEPTSALDPLAEKQLYEAFIALSEGKQSFFVSHRLGSTQYCDRILVFDRGRIVQDGTHKALLNTKGLYQDIYTSQAKYYQSADASTDASTDVSIDVSSDTRKEA